MLYNYRCSSNIVQWPWREWGIWREAQYFSWVKVKIKYRLINFQEYLHHNALGIVSSSRFDQKKNTINFILESLFYHNKIIGLTKNTIHSCIYLLIIIMPKDKIFWVWTLKNIILDLNQFVNTKRKEFFKDFFFEFFYMFKDVASVCLQQNLWIESIFCNKAASIQCLCPLRFSNTFC